jgi:hypothetical protein
MKSIQFCFQIKTIYKFAWMMKRNSIFYKDKMKIMKNEKRKSFFFLNFFLNFFFIFPLTPQTNQPFTDSMNY